MIIILFIWKRIIFFKSYQLFSNRYLIEKASPVQIKCSIKYNLSQYKICFAFHKNTGLGGTHSKVFSLGGLERVEINLPWSFHADVVSLEHDEADKLLDRAEAEGWNRKSLREEVRKIKGLFAPQDQEGEQPFGEKQEEEGVEQSAADTESTSEEESDAPDASTQQEVTAE